MIFYEGGKIITELFVLEAECIFLTIHYTLSDAGQCTKKELKITLAYLLRIKRSTFCCCCELIQKMIIGLILWKKGKRQTKLYQVFNSNFVELCGLTAVSEMVFFKVYCTEPQPYVLSGMLQMIFILRRQFFVKQGMLLSYAIILACFR